MWKDYHAEDAAVPDWAHERIRRVLKLVREWEDEKHCVEMRMSLNTKKRELRVMLRARPRPNSAKGAPFSLEADDTGE